MLTPEFILRCAADETTPEEVLQQFIDDLCCQSKDRNVTHVLATVYYLHAMIGQRI